MWPMVAVVVLQSPQLLAHLAHHDELVDVEEFAEVID